MQKQYLKACKNTTIRDGGGNIISTLEQDDIIGIHITHTVNGNIAGWVENIESDYGTQVIINSKHFSKI